MKGEIIIVTLFIRCRKELKERIRLFSKEEGISINKMVIKLLELGILKYIEGGMRKNENDIK